MMVLGMYEGEKWQLHPLVSSTEPQRLLLMFLVKCNMISDDVPMRNGEGLTLRFLSERSRCRLHLTTLLGFVRACRFRHEH
jgi:hypothetical protein